MVNFRCKRKIRYYLAEIGDLKIIFALYFSSNLEKKKVKMRVQSYLNNHILIAIFIFALYLVTKKGTTQ